VEFVTALMGLALVGWGVFFLRFHNVPVGAMVFLVATSVFPPELFSLRFPGINLTLDRIWLGIIVLQFLFNFYRGGTKLRGLRGTDTLLIVFLIWLLIRTLMTPIGMELKGQPSTMMHLINGYLSPVLLYFLIRHSEIKTTAIWPMFAILLAFGVYLSLTAIFEVTKQWSLVVPSFISDPKLGIHFGRARGPMLQSVRLGMCLNFALAALWTFPFWLQSHRKWAWILNAALSPLFLVAILLTYTRSIWMGAGVIVVVLMLTMLRGRTRIFAVGSLAVCGLFGGLVIGPNLVAFKREYTEAETLESTRMRGAFAYVSWKMFQEKPIAGFGFNQFQVYNRPYLDDRTTNIRLESIRGYVHHNSYLSLLVDLGLVGGTLFLLVSVAFLRNAWIIWRHPMVSDYARSAAVLFFCMAGVHAIQMAFHEVSFSTIEYTILLIPTALCQVFCDELRELADRSQCHYSLESDEAISSLAISSQVFSAAVE
jgi:O-antigen ligase